MEASAINFQITVYVLNLHHIYSFKFMVLKI